LSAKSDFLPAYLLLYNVGTQLFFGQTRCTNQFIYQTKSMKAKPILFFTQADNLGSVAPKKKVEKTTMGGSISKRGSLVFALNVAEELGLTSTAKHFRVGVLEGKRKISAIYLVPSDDSQADVFPVQKVGRGYGIGLAGILAKSGINYKQTRYTFSVQPMDMEQGNGFELRLKEPATPAPLVEGAKRRGRPRSTPAPTV
jgi:hypothetical protein